MCNGPYLLILLDMTYHQQKGAELRALELVADLQLLDEKMLAQTRALTRLNLQLTPR